VKVFVDENIPAMTVRELRKLGHEIMDIRGTEHEGMTDEDVWEMVQKNGMLLITTDKGFAQKRHEKHNGILIIRLKQPNRLKLHQKVMKAIGRFSEEEWFGLTVVMQDTFHSVWKVKR
jgi:predicted nuclease of predicted toxin-antitoxin system